MRYVLMHIVTLYFANWMVLSWREFSFSLTVNFLTHLNVFSSFTTFVSSVISVSLNKFCKIFDIKYMYAKQKATNRRKVQK